MNIEKPQKIQQSPKPDPLLQKMWRAQNIKNSLSKLSKLSSKCSPTQSPMQISLLSNSENVEKFVVAAGTAQSSRENGGGNGGKCRKCERLGWMVHQQKSLKRECQQKYKQLSQKYAQLTTQHQTLTKNLQKLQKALQQTHQSINPYKNNVILMQQHLQSIKDSLIGPQHHNDRTGPHHPHSEQYNNHKKIQKQFDQKKRTMDFQFDFLRKTHEREQENNQSKMSRLNFVITYMENKNKELQAQNVELARSNKILNGIIHESGYVVQQRQLFHMASEQLYQVKNQYKKQKKQKQYLTRLVQKLKNKIFMLTSLIGYGVVSNIENNDLHDLNQIKNNIQKANKLQSKLTLDIYGIQSLKNYKSCYHQIKQYSSQDEPFNCLYHSNFLILFEDQQIKTALQQNVTTIIKPQFFLLIRAIFDSKYAQFLVEGEKANRFPEFAYSFIDCFRVRKNQKRIEIYAKKIGDQRDFMKTNFLLRVFDRKVGYMPEMVTFREFLIKNTPQDQIFYYLMCRNLIFDGPEIQNYINCSDPYNFVSYQRVLSRVQQLLQYHDKTTKTIVFNHLNQRKILKNRRLLIKSNYTLRLLLHLYRKQKHQKLQKLRHIFEQTSKFTKTECLKYTHFREILAKNFTYLTNSDICEFYRRAMSIYQSQGQVTFFQAFNVTCVEEIFLREGLRWDEGVRARGRDGEGVGKGVGMEGCNYVMELVPEAVSQLGNQSIYNQYLQFLKLKSINLHTRTKISKFLLKLIQLRLHTLDKYPSHPHPHSHSPTQPHPEHHTLTQILDQLNNTLIDLLNQNFKKRQQYEENLNKASARIGREFKRKIYQFYSEFVKDIKQQICGEDGGM